MKTTVDKILENALDLDVFGVDDLASGNIRPALDNSYVTFYYATTADNFWDVVTNGIDTTKPGVKLFTDMQGASDHAYRSTGLRRDNNIVVFEIETKVKKPKKMSDLDALLYAGFPETQSMFSDTIPPREILRVSLSHSYATLEGTKKVAKEAAKGMFAWRGIPANPDFKGIKRVNRKTIEDWRHKVLAFAENLMNYSSNFFDYLVHRVDNGVNYKQVILIEATKLGWSQMYAWKNAQMAEWLYAILPLPPIAETPKEDDIQQMCQSAYPDVPLHTYRN